MERLKAPILLSPARPLGGGTPTALKLDIARDIVAKLRAAGMPCELIIPADEPEEQPRRM
jgi:hypothetical protein